MLADARFAAGGDSANILAEETTAALRFPKYVPIVPFGTVRERAAQCVGGCRGEGWHAVPATIKLHFLTLLYVSFSFSHASLCLH